MATAFLISPFRSKTARSKTAPVSPTKVHCTAQIYRHDDVDKRCPRRSLEQHLRHKALPPSPSSHPMITPSSSFSIPSEQPPTLDHDSPPWSTTCLQPWLAEQLQAWFPLRVSASRHWKLLFSLGHHGCSIQTLYHHARQCTGPMLIVIRTDDDQILGAYLSEALKNRSNYYGTGECFLWTSPNKHTVQVYPWTGINDYTIFSNQDFIAIGGGEGQIGLFLHADLYHGHTQQCETFANDPLTQPQQFECLDLELWQFLY
ncbi:TLD-domain-containing protein [Gongronella butleri]|nr:TLD-domain-containing protein [Gongronella butleri]